MDELLHLRHSVSERIKATSAVSKLLSGDSAIKVYGHYLSNVWHYAQHSAIVIGMAGARAVPRNPKMADYLLHHAREELGHEQWALEDLEALHISADEVKNSRPVVSCAAMIGYEYFIAGHSNPIGLFGWLYILEAMGEDLGHLMAKHITEELGLRSSVKFLASHGDADEAHTSDLTTQLKKNLYEQDRLDVYQVANVVADLYVRMFNEIGEQW
jgi:hypothetical protein